MRLGGVEVESNERVGLGPSGTQSESRVERRPGGVSEPFFLGDVGSYGRAEPDDLLITTVPAAIPPRRKKGAHPATTPELHARIEGSIDGQIEPTTTLPNKHISQRRKFHLHEGILLLWAIARKDGSFR